MTHLAIMCGLPRSGKSTYAARLREGQGWTVICPDEVRYALHGRPYFQEAEPFVWAMCETMARALLRNNHKVLIDATNTTKKRRAPWLRIAREFDINPLAFVMLTSPEECHRRNKDNLPSLPNDVIERMADQFEHIERVEGFDPVFVGC